MRILKFMLVGASGIFVNEFFLWFLTEISGLYYLVSSLISIEIAIISNFILNEFWTFRDMSRKSQKNKDISKRFLKYNILNIGGMIINIVGLYFFTSLGIYYLISNVIAIGIGFLWNYFFSLKWAWKSKIFAKEIKPIKNPKVSVIIPTYNEKENIKILIPKIFEVFRKNRINGEVIIVDDNSPDGTGDAADQLSKKFNVKVLHRKGKSGLGSAVVEGFEASKGNILGVMDADLSHPPELIPKMLNLIKNNKADVIFASRYAKGGCVENWSIKRKIISKGASLLAKGLTSVKDPMSGFFLLKREVVENVDLNPKGYKIGLEILAKGRYSKINEIPYTFVDRKIGKSKMNWKEMYNYIKHVTSLYWYKVNE
jgi:dolichol-phosphate mannosyltransferase